MWHLEKIPKILHVYWGGGKLAYLRYLTLATFRYYNPEWEIILHKPLFPTGDISWITHEQKYGDEYTDCFDKIEKLSIEIRDVDFSVLGFDNKASEVHKSDFLRWHLLSEYGGLWADMDIVFTRSMNELCFNISENKDVNTVFCICEYGHSIGFLMSSKNNNYFGRIKQEAIPEYRKENYQCIGSILCNKLFPTLDSAKKDDIMPINLPMDIVYAYNANHVRELFSDSAPDRFTPNTIGVHWYAGHELAGRYLNRTAGGCNIDTNFIVDQLIRKFKASSFDFIYKYKLWGSEETVSGEGSTLKATMYIRERLPDLFGRYNIKRVLDMGCGDVNWMKEMIPYFDLYHGVDVVQGIVDKNTLLYGNEKVFFGCGDIRYVDFPCRDFDVVIIADVLVHFTYSDIDIILNKLARKNIKYLLMTHFSEHKQNSNILTGDWRVLNFTKEPFNFPPPIEVIPYNEPYDIGYGISNDKTLSLWALPIQK